MYHSIVPPYLLLQLSTLQREDLRAAAEAARRTLASATGPQVRTTTALPTQPAEPVDPSGPDRTVSDAAGSESLPGRTVRREGDDPSGDVAVDEAYDGLGATYALYSQVYGRASIDGAGLPLLASVHYGTSYDNAFWDGGQMVFGDGDGQVFGRFTASLSVIGHELTHGVTQYTANLDYQGQSGALNESVSDVFGALVEQYARGQSAATASWLIGVGLFTDQVEGEALRSMKAPGTAYDDDVLGKDPQPADMSGYVETSDDNGGVHLNSGIPNRAFYLVASALGGNAWDRAGQIWYDTLTGGLAGSASFVDFAAATASAASARYGSDSAEHRAVLDAWSTVGVTPVATPAATPDSTPADAAPSETTPAETTSADSAPSQTVPFHIVVARTGGFAGLRREWSIEVPDDRAAEHWRPLIEACPWDATGDPGNPDGFVYEFRAAERSAVIPETRLDDPWQRLADEVRQQSR